MKSTKQTVHSIPIYKTNNNKELKTEQKAFKRNLEIEFVTQHACTMCTKNKHHDKLGMIPIKANQILKLADFPKMIVALTLNDVMTPAARNFQL